MRFLLVNSNSAVKKIFNITAKKISIDLDMINSISDIPLDEDYNCIFIDDGVLNTGNLEEFKSKMITTKFCLILGKDSPIKSGFDSYIRKPFLPTDIYEVLKKEKTNDMNLSSESYDQAESSKEGVNADINLEHFSDHSDEFLSGVQSDSIISPEIAPIDENIIQAAPENEINLELSPNEISDDLELATPLENEPIDILKDDDIIGLKDEAIIQPSAPPAEEISEPESKAQNSADDIDFSSIFAMQDEFLQTQTKNVKKSRIGGDGYKKKEPAQPKNESPQAQPAQNKPAQAQNITPAQNKPAQTPPKNIQAEPVRAQKPVEKNIEVERRAQKPVEKNVENTIRTQKKIEPKIEPVQEVENIESDIDISATFNEMDEAVNEAEIAQDAQTDSANEDFALDSAADSAENGDLDFDNLFDENLDDFEFDSKNITDINDEIPAAPRAPHSNDDIIDQLDIATLNPNESTPEPAESAPNNDNMLGFQLDDDIKDLSDEDLANLDDEALLALQEQSLNNLSESSKEEPKILNKNDINELTNMLEATSKNDNFNSLTHEALNEALGEEKIEHDFDQIPEIKLENDAEEIIHEVNPPPSVQVSPNANLDLTEIIKTFPIDKLRELLSGVQITINITFPNKKK